MKSLAEMTEQEKLQVRNWVRNWQELGPVLEQMRRESIKKTDTAKAMEAFESAYKSARLHGGRHATSGLVEQQHWFKRGHR